MIMLVNGAFGIGKTSVARLIASGLADTLVYDPEPIGIVLQRGCRLVGHAVDDFQDLAAWRRLTIAGIRLARRMRSNVVVPMAFSNPAYLEEIITGISRSDQRVLHCCLIAPIDVVHARLASRGDHPRSRNGEWQYRRATECCAVHGGPSFSEQISAIERDPDQIAKELIRKALQH